MCEGETERNYFLGMKEDEDFKQALSAVNPQVVKAKNPTPEQVLKEATGRVEKALRENNPYDSVWLVFDHDNHEHRETAFDQAKKEGFHVAFSAIAFETWFLMHFAKSARAFQNAEELIKTLRKYYANYEKANQNDFDNLKQRLETGMENAEWLRSQKSSPHQHLTDCNPWTDVDVLVKELLEMK